MAQIPPTKSNIIIGLKSLEEDATKALEGKHFFGSDQYVKLYNELLVPVQTLDLAITGQPIREGGEGLSNKDHGERILLVRLKCNQLIRQLEEKEINKSKIMCVIDKNRVCDCREPLPTEVPFAFLIASSRLKDEHDMIKEIIERNIRLISPAGENLSLQFIFAADSAQENQGLFCPMIMGYIRRAKLVVVVLTSDRYRAVLRRPNENVWFEFGIANTLDGYVMSFIKSRLEIPSDLKGVNIPRYEKPSDLREKMKQMLTTPGRLGIFFRWAD